MHDRRMRPDEVGTHTIMYEAKDYIHSIDHEGSEMDLPPLTDDDRHRDGTPQDAMRHTRESKPLRSGVLSVSAGTYRDDITGQPLAPELCKAARQKELDYFESKKVWEVRPISEAKARTGKPPISVRWVEVNKGDDINPNVRSRLVAREIKQPGQESIFAPTPPLESLRMVLSYATTQFKGKTRKTWEAKSEKRMQVSMIDISRAYFNAKTDPRDLVYVQFPPDMGAPSGTCGLLRRHMYGTRRAAEGWQDECSSTLVDLGFTQGSASACVFCHLEQDIVVSVHGDDFTAAGPKISLDWYEGEMETRYELTKG